MEWLEANASEAKEARENITAYLLPDGKWINVLAEGRLVNIAASNGHPAGNHGYELRSTGAVSALCEE